MVKVKKNKKGGEAEAITVKVGAKEYQLKLYITGMTPRSSRAVNNINNICEEYLRGRYEIEVIDLYENPELASADQIIAAPTLIKKTPLPVYRILGDLSHSDKVLEGLGIVTSSTKL